MELAFPPHCHLDVFFACLVSVAYFRPFAGRLWVGVGVNVVSQWQARYSAVSWSGDIRESHVIAAPVLGRPVDLAYVPVDSHLLCSSRHEGIAFQ